LERALCAGRQKGLAVGRIVVYEADQEQLSRGRWRLIRRIGAAGILKRRFENQERADCRPSRGVELAKTLMVEACSSLVRWIGLGVLERKCGTRLEN
jgi:hypothetical protein